MMRLDMKRLATSVAIAGALDVFPALAFLDVDIDIVPGPPLGEIISYATGFLSLPGIVVGLIADGGNVHTISPAVIVAANFAVYAFVAYKVLGWWRRNYKGAAADSATAPY